MNLRTIVRGAVTRINPDIPVTIKQSSGSTTLPDGARVPTYTVHLGVPAQVQALSNDELHQLEGLNIQGNKCAVYLNGNWSGIVRASAQGGDLFEFEGQTWLATVVLENWGVPGTADAWVKLALTQQTVPAGGGTGTGTEWDFGGTEWDSGGTRWDGAPAP